VTSLTPLVRALLLAWAALWLVSFLTWLADSSLSDWLALDPAALFAGRWSAAPGLLGYALVHDPTPSGLLFHLGFNAYLLYFFGPEIERLYPGRRFLLLLLLAAIAGAALHLLLAAGLPLFHSAVIGGSGLVMAVVAASAAHFPGLIINLFLLRVRLLHLFLALVVLDLVGFLATAFGKGEPIATDVHLAGAATGWLWARGLGALAAPLAGWQARRRSASARRRAESAMAEERELDRILAKIGRDGMPSLTEAERRFLERRSRRRGSAGGGARLPRKP
jgi:membrane associated rhomboid family serine protease